MIVNSLIMINRYAAYLAYIHKYKKKDRKLMSFSGFQKKKTQFEYKINVIIKEQNNLKKSIINY